jgi:secreted Zn-dependent insulinase-like peptidase
MESSSAKDARLDQDKPPTLRQETIILADADDFVQPDRDLRQYRRIRLPNNLECLLVSDDKSTGVGVEAGAVHVQAGHMDDTLPGLAHFNEHMLFLGTAKYPTEDEYETFLQQAGTIELELGRATRISCSLRRTHHE